MHNGFLAHAKWNRGGVTNILSMIFRHIQLKLQLTGTELVTVPLLCSHSSDIVVELWFYKFSLIFLCTLITWIEPNFMNDLTHLWCNSVQKKKIYIFVKCALFRWLFIGTDSHFNVIPLIFSFFHFCFVVEFRCDFTFSHQIKRELS